MTEQPKPISTTIQTVEPCGLTQRLCEYNISCFQSFYSSKNPYSYKPSLVRVGEFVLSELTAAFNKDTEIHQKNIPAIEANKAIRSKINALMNEVGMPDTYKERDEKSRARIRKYITHTSGYIQDIQRWCAISDGYERCQEKYREYFALYSKQIEEEKLKEKSEQDKLERAEKEKLESRKKDIEFAALLLRNNLPIDSEWENVLDSLRSKNKYIDLAFSMRQVRGDWNDGCGPVEQSLSAFTIVSTIDKEIEKCVSENVNQFNGECRDGRLFRDCEWNYDSILGLVEDKQLLQDAELAYDKSQESRY